MDKYQWPKCRALSPVWWSGLLLKQQTEFLSEQEPNEPHLTPAQLCCPWGHRGPFARVGKSWSHFGCCCLVNRPKFLIKFHLNPQFCSDSNIHFHSSPTSVMQHELKSSSKSTGITVGVAASSDQGQTQIRLTTDSSALLPLDVLKANLKKLNSFFNVIDEQKTTVVIYREKALSLSK